MEQENPDSLGVLVAKAFDAAENGTLEAPQLAEAEELPEDEVDTEDTEETPEKDAVESDSEIESESEEADTEEEAEEEPEAEHEDPEEVRDPIKAAPSSWSKASKSLYDKLPEDVKREVHKREADFHAGYQTLKPKADFADRVAAAMQPYQQTLIQLQQQGVDAPTAINKLLQADHILRYSKPEQKAAYLAELAVQYGVDIGSLSQVPKPDPQVISMRQQLESMQMQRAQEMQAQQMQQQQKLAEEIQKFASNPKHEHFAAVREEMAVLMETGKAATLQEAYDQAVWMRPEIRQTLLERRETEAKQKALQDTQRKRARTAAVSPKGSQAGKPGKAAGGDIRGILETLL